MMRADKPPSRKSHPSSSPRGYHEQVPRGNCICYFCGEEYHWSDCNIVMIGKTVRHLCRRC